MVRACLPAISRDVCVTGCSSGVLYEWKDGVVVAAHPGHDGACFSLHVYDNGSGIGLLSGGKDGKIIVYSNSLAQLRVIDVGRHLSALLTSAMPGIRSLHTRNGLIVAGFASSVLVEVDTTKGDAVTLLNQGHSASNTQAGRPADYQGEVWGLGVHPSQPVFATAGDDKTLRLYDLKTHKLLCIRGLPAAGRSLAFSPDASSIAVGLIDGRMLIVDSPSLTTFIEPMLLTVTADFSPKSTGGLLSGAGEEISAIQYSPLGDVIAAGCHDNSIYLVSCIGKKLGSLKGHSSFITHLDFSADGRYLQTNCGTYEILFWDVSSREQITRSNEVRDIRWSSYTCPVSWGSIGVFPPGYDGSDVNCMDVSKKKPTLCVIGDDFRYVQLMRYPCRDPKAQRYRYRGHSEHVAGVRFSYDDEHVVSVGGADLCSMVWRVVPVPVPDPDPTAEPVPAPLPAPSPVPAPAPDSTADPVPVPVPVPAPAVEVQLSDGMGSKMAADVRVTAAEKAPEQQTLSASVPLEISVTVS
mmetsp:Transcript_43623/g.70852  ORF Transcript_43623/g.70852 Transcript_43623/m.70852 type:complete len:523 (+) Transcript_43623:877-2445(+)